MGRVGILPSSVTMQLQEKKNQLRQAIENKSLSLTAAKVVLYSPKAKLFRDILTELDLLDLKRTITRLVNRPVNRRQRQARRMERIHRKH